MMHGQQNIKLMKLVSLLGMFLIETYNKIWVGQYLSDMF
jgi:hypothetical protein